MDFLNGALRKLALVLLVFGAVKGKLTGANPLKSSLQTALVGGLAAGAAFYLASLFG
jgi:VIT1/CCC1 family predicted Fe2+/Mn2+ transporter|nr:VIT1/CCC1 transporter family protein [Rhodoblastus sp.]